MKTLYIPKQDRNITKTEDICKCPLFLWWRQQDLNL